MRLSLGMAVLFKLVLLTCGNYYSSHTDKMVSLQAITCSIVHAANYVVLASSYCRSGISTSVSKSESIASSASTDDKTPTVQHKPVTSLAGGNNALAHYSNVATIKYHIHY